MPSRTAEVRCWASFFILIAGLFLFGPLAQSDATTVRFATFNTSLNLCLDDDSSPCLAGGLPAALAEPSFRSARQVAEILQRVAPDVVLLNEFNFDDEGTSARLFQENFLAVGQNISNSDVAASAIDYPYVYAAPVNTGVASGFDLDNNGSIALTQGNGLYGNDAFGFGEFPGRYGMLLLSKFPIQTDAVRTFQNFLWKDLPGAFLPDDASTAAPNDWYTAEELAAVRLSSKSHWDVPIQIEDRVVHALVSHPTPPVFDGDEDRNGRRNHDEIRLWADYVTPGNADYLTDDEGKSGGLDSEASFVVLGDLNADPSAGDSFNGAINQLLEHPRIDASEVPLTFGGRSTTATFGLRVDYVLPSSDLNPIAAAVFEPAPRDPLRRLVGASDHRLVWTDVDVRTVPEPGGMLPILIALVALVTRRRPL